MDDGLHDWITLEYLDGTSGEKELEVGSWRGFWKHSGAWVSHWRCMALFINFGFFFHSILYRTSGDEAKWFRPGLVKRHGGNVIHTWRLRGGFVSPKAEGMIGLEVVLGCILFQSLPSFPSYPPPVAT